MQFENLLAYLEGSINSESIDSVKKSLNSLSAQEIAHQIESTPSKFRQIIWSLVDPDTSGEVMHDLSDEIQNEILEDMDASSVALLTSGLDIDEVVDILQHIPEQIIPTVLNQMSKQDRKRIEEVLTYPEDTAGGMMNPDVITVRPDITVKIVLRYLRRFESIPSNYDNIFVVDRSDKFIGTLPINKLLTSSSSKTIDQIIERDYKVINANISDSDVAMTLKFLILFQLP